IIAATPRRCSALPTVRAPAEYRAEPRSPPEFSGMLVGSIQRIPINIPPLCIATPSSMNTIAQLLTPPSIALDVDADSKARLFEQAGALFERSAGLPRTVVSASLAAREKLG